MLGDPGRSRLSFLPSSSQQRGGREENGPALRGPGAGPLLPEPTQWAGSAQCLGVRGLETEPSLCHEGHLLAGRDQGRGGGHLSTALLRAGEGRPQPAAARTLRSGPRAVVWPPRTGVSWGSYRDRQSEAGLQAAKREED